MKVLVTGNRGYIGTVLVPLLLDAGYDVEGFDSDLYRRSVFTQLPYADPVTSKIKDIRDVQIEDLEGYEAIIHLAGLSNDPLGFLKPKMTYEINHHASTNLARLAKEAGVKRFLYASSCSNYGISGEEYIDEEGLLNPITPYAVSKLNVEKDLKNLADHNFCVTSLRNATAYGFSKKIRFDLVVNNLVAWAFTTKKIFLKSDGTSIRPLVHIEDISRAFLEILKAPQSLVENQIFNVGRTEENYRIIDLVKIISEYLPEATLEFAQSASKDKRSYKVNCDKIKKVLPGFNPVWTVRKGVEELVRAYEKINLRASDFEGPTYKRVVQIQELIHNKCVDETLRITSKF